MVFLFMREKQVFKLLSTEKMQAAEKVKHKQHKFNAMVKVIEADKKYT